MYTFYQSVYHASHNQSFPSTSEEKHGLVLVNMYVMLSHTNSWILHRIKYQKFGILHIPECLTVDVPCLDHLWEVQKDYPGDKQIIWSMREIPGNMPLCTPLGPLRQSCHASITYGSICRVVVITTDHLTCGKICHV